MVVHALRVSSYVAFLRPGFILPLRSDGRLNRHSYPIGRNTRLRVIPAKVKRDALRFLEGWSPPTDAASTLLKGPLFALSSSSRNAERSVADAALALWLSHPCGFSLQPILTYERVEGQEALRAFNSNEIMLLGAIGDADAHFSRQDISAADRLARALDRSGGAVRIAATLLMTAASTWSQQVQFLLRWMALEALFGTDEKTELSFRLRQNISLFHAKGEVEAITLFALLGKWYGARSRLAHGAGLRLTEKEYRDFRNFVIAVFRRVLSSVATRETFSSNKDRIKFLASLAFARRRWKTR